MARLNVTDHGRSADDAALPRIAALCLGPEADTLYSLTHAGGRIEADQAEDLGGVAQAGASPSSILGATRRWSRPTRARRVYMISPTAVPSVRTAR